MKDGILLLLTGLVVAGLSWAFWHFLGADAMNVWMTIMLAGIAADNFRLRKKLRNYVK